MSVAAPNAPAVKIEHTDCFIDGKWVPAESGKTFATINPATEQVIAEVAEGDAVDVENAAQAARRAFESGDWAKMDARDRGKAMMRLADLIEANKDELAALDLEVDPRKRVGLDLFRVEDLLEVLQMDEGLVAGHPGFFV